VVDAEQMVAIKVSKYEVILEMVDFDGMAIMHTKVKTCIM
jgi:hypothetical protein